MRVYSLNMLSSGTESDSSASSDVDFDDYGVWLPTCTEYTEEELRQMEEAASPKQTTRDEQKKSKEILIE
jgi:hypothetical protein